MKTNAKAESITIIIPCFNEQECIPILLDQLNRQFMSMGSFDWSVLFVDDGSVDRTESIILDRIDSSERYCFDITLISLSRNFGKEAALIAGLDNFNGDACVIMDADLQDPPDLIPAMVSSWRNGFDIVTAKRSNRESDSWLKKSSANLFYRLFRVVSKLNIELDASDFRLLDKSVVEAITRCRESVRFSKGFFAWAGFRSSTISFSRPERFLGDTKWGMWRLWNYALDGIFNFSIAPLKVWSYVGVAIIVISFFLGVKELFKALMFGAVVPGYASIFVALTFLGGIQLIGIGAIGEYVGRIYLESKRRPLYVIKTLKSTSIN